LIKEIIVNYGQVSGNTAPGAGEDGKKDPKNVFR
jgi:hypothetical protein